MKTMSFCRLPLLALLAGLAAGTASAQNHHQQGSDAAATARPHAGYSGYSAEERAEGLREGRGMGLALAAETNGYPGPRHALELAEALELTPEQREKTQRLLDEMDSQARGLGERLMREEEALDALFAGKRASKAELVRVVNAAAETEAKLKIVHLETHLAMMTILTPAQVTSYVELRRAGAGSGRTRPRS